MCGLAGLAASDPGRPLSEELRSEVAIMLSALSHRGPDGEGIAGGAGAALGHRRLAIIDLTDRASQPMALRCGSHSEEREPRAWLAFNGEIYNYLELRRELSGRGHTFRSDGDTETILHLYEEEGPACLARLRGMFAMALWDASARRLLLARDRLGKKPLYYREGPGGLAFASEIKAIAALLRARGEPVAPDSSALRSYLALKYVPGPETAVAGIRKLPPAHLLIYERGHAEVRPWWELPRAAAGPARAEELAEELREAVRESVRLRMRSDVPLGLFLSGGLDSGVVASSMARAARTGEASGARIRTFTVGFGERDYDELRAASRVARALGTEHHEIAIRPAARQTTDLLPELAWHLDQPFADSSALAVYHLAREVKRHVSVALSGDGGDELFLGYDRYRAHRLADALARAPGGGSAGSRLGAWLLRAKLASVPGRRNLAGRARRFALAAGLAPLQRNDAWITCIDRDVAAATVAPELLAGDDPLGPIHRTYARAGATDPLLAIQRADLLVWLPDDILHKVDAMTMAHGLEARAPLLDHRVVELAMRIPPDLELRWSRGKEILRRAFAAELPRRTIRGRKAGFGLPLDHWLRRELAGYCRDLLLERRTLERGILVRRGLESLLREHREGAANREEAIWSLVMLEHWFRAAIDAGRSEAVRPAGRTAPAPGMLGIS